MAKRKLSQNQKRRVDGRHQDNLAQSNSESSDKNTKALHGIVITNFGRKALIEYEDIVEVDERIEVDEKAKGETKCDDETNNQGQIDHKTLSTKTQPCLKRSQKRSQKLCHLRANLDSIVTGDRVIWRKDNENKTGVIESRFPRETELQRPDSYGNLKPVAANVTQMLITICVAPEPHINLIDRYIVAAINHGLEPVIIVNKSDLLSAGKPDIFLQIEELYLPLGYKIIYVGAHDNFGFDDLKRQLAHHTSIFAGQSGVGKSSLIKSLLPEQEIKVGELSQIVSKGKHTTTHSCLYHFPWGGHCIDSPGIREFGLWHFNPSEIVQGFIEIESLSENCRFRDCTHNNTPGCAITQAVADNKIHPARFESFNRIISGLDDVSIKTKK